MKNFEQKRVLDKISELIEVNASKEDIVNLLRNIDAQCPSSAVIAENAQNRESPVHEKIPKNVGSNIKLLQKYRNYFEEWLNIPVEQIIQARGILLTSNEKRSLKPRGWLVYLPICIFETEQAMIISCVPSWMKELNEKLANAEIPDVMPIIREYADNKNLYCDGYLIYGLEALNEKVDYSEAILMDNTQYNQYLEFCRKTYPALYELIEPDNEMVEDFKNMIEKETRFCKIIDGKIVSMTESENVPNKPEGIVNLGINTLRDYRRKGYATEVCAAFIDNCVRRDVLPIWQCDINNTASQSLAEKLGFKCLGSVYNIPALIESW